MLQCVGYNPRVLAVLIPLLVAPAIILLGAVTRTWPVRLAVGIPLVATVLFLCAAAGGLFYRPGFPTVADGLLIYGPVLLLFCVVAWLVERLRLGQPRPATNVAAWVLMLGLFALSVCSWSCLVGLVPRVSKEPPSSNLVLPLPDGLTLVDQQRDCGSAECSRAIVIGSPDHASEQELTERLWAHLETTMGWQRVGPHAATQTPGWLVRRRVCLFVHTESPGDLTVLLDYDSVVGC